MSLTNSSQSDGGMALDFSIPIFSESPTDDIAEYCIRRVCSLQNSKELFLFSPESFPTFQFSFYCKINFVFYFIVRIYVLYYFS